MARPARKSAVPVSRGLAGVCTVSPAPPGQGACPDPAHRPYYALEE